MQQRSIQTERHGQGLRVLVVDEALPYPPYSGKPIRTWNLLSRLARRHQITLLCYGEKNERGLAAIRAAGIEVHLVDPVPNLSGWRLYARLFGNLFSPLPFAISKHYTRRFQRQLDLLLQESRFDLLHCEWTHYILFLKAVDRIPLLVSTHAVESQIVFRRAKQTRTILGKMFFHLQGIKMERFEERALRRANVVTTVSPLDSNVIRSWGVRSVKLVENGVDLDCFKESAEVYGAPELLFLGSLDWYPNVDALIYLFEQIMPTVHLQRPGTRLRIVGRRPSPQLIDRVASLEWAELAADVSDVRPWLAESSVVVVPLRIGGGSRIKILESLAACKAVVSTSIGAEGLRVVPGEHLEIADAPEEFAHRIVRLLESPRERRRLGRNGRELATEHYSWDTIARALEAAWYQACAWKEGVGPRPETTSPIGVESS